MTADRARRDAENLQNWTQANKARIQAESPTHEALIDLAAAQQAENELLKNRILRLESRLKQSREFSAHAVKYFDPYLDALQKASNRKQVRKKAAKSGHAEDDRKRNAIREIWSSGKYKSKTVCAASEFKRLCMSLDTARKALRNMPNPT